MAVTKLKQRLVSSFVLIPLVILATWFDEPVAWLTLGACLWGGLAVLEFYRLVNRHDTSIQPATGLGIIWTVFLIASPQFSHGNWQLNVLFLGVVASLAWSLFDKNRQKAFISWGWTVAGVIYVGLLLSILVSLRLFDNGAGWVFLALFTTFASDTSAFFAGSLLGGRHLAPHISPHKTWSGAIGGLLGAMAISPLVAGLFSLPVNWLQAVGLGLFISIFGQIGDLAESLLKRNMHAKDSGNSVPGHGGCLDRMDSVVFAVIVVYCYVIWLG